MSNLQHPQVVLPPDIAAALRVRHHWLVTGGAGFIGSNLCLALLRHGQQVTVLDDFSTGSERNVDFVRAATAASSSDFKVITGSCADEQAVDAGLAGVDFVLHQAALGSIPRSFANPLPTDVSNVHGFVTALHRAGHARVRSFVFASSSSVYGTSERLPKVEDEIGAPLSPYAVSKLANELYACVLAPRLESTGVVGLRYFNVFGPLQNPAGAYAAVIPRWIGEMLAGQPTTVFGDGTQSRDFCFVANVVQANIRAAIWGSGRSGFTVMNIAAGARTSLLELHATMREMVAALRPDLSISPPALEPRRAGDIPHSHADIARAMTLLGYRPSHSVREGLKETVEWFVAQAKAS